MKVAFLTQWRPLQNQRERVERRPEIDTISVFDNLNPGPHLATEDISGKANAGSRIRSRACGVQDLKMRYQGRCGALHKVMFTSWRSAEIWRGTWGKTRTKPSVSPVSTSFHGLPKVANVIARRELLCACATRISSRQTTSCGLELGRSCLVWQSLSKGMVHCRDCFHSGDQCRSYPLSKADLIAVCVSGAFVC